MHMLRQTVWWILFCLFFATPCLPQTPKAHPGNDDSLAVRQSDQACLSEILISSAPQSDRPERITEARHKAERLRKAVQMGDSFADLARANSQGPTATQGGAIGCFKRGQLSKQLEERVFRLQVGEVSEVLHTKQGFVILEVTEHD